MKKTVAAASFAIAVTINFISNLVSSEPGARDWYQHYRPAVLALVPVGLIVGILLSIASANDEARETHTASSIGSILRAIISDIANWAAFGVLVGMIVSWQWGGIVWGSEWFVTYVVSLTNTQAVAVVGWIPRVIHDLGPLGFSGIIAGAAVGTRLRYTSPDQPADLVVAGIVLGAISGYGTAQYLSQIETIRQLAPLGAAGAPGGAAFLCISWAAVTAPFRPHYDVKRYEREREIDEEAVLLERVIAKVTCNGLYVVSHVSFASVVDQWFASLDLTGIFGAAGTDSRMSRSPDTARRDAY